MHRLHTRLQHAGTGGTPLAAASSPPVQEATPLLRTPILTSPFAAVARTQVSGYIDFAHRLRTENMEAFFEGKRRLIPKPTDLSFYNWFTKVSAANPTADFQILADDELGLLFKNKHDRKIINVDPWAETGEAAERTELETDGEYLQVVIFDHYEATEEPLPVGEGGAGGGSRGGARR